MGALLDGQRRRLGTSAALALILVLALAGSTSPASRSDAAGARAALLAAPASPAPADQPAASVTVPDERRHPERSAAPGLAPAVHVTTLGSPAGRAVHADVAVIADILLKAYRSAVAGSPAGCHLPVSLLAAIGQVESGSLVGRPIDAQHRTSVVGPVLDGRHYAPVPDTDHGRLDGDPTWDRGVGPMQFLPGTWRTFGVDGDGNGVADPQDVEDAAASAAGYLCYGGRDLTQQAVLRTALLSYNQSVAYLRLVLTYQQRFTPLDSPTAVGLPTLVSLTATPVVTPSVAPPVAAGRRPAATARSLRHPHRTRATRTPAADPSRAPKKQPAHAPAPTPTPATTTAAAPPPTATPTPATSPATSPAPPTGPAAPATSPEQAPGTATPPATGPGPTPTQTPEPTTGPTTGPSPGEDPGTPAPSDPPGCPTAPLPPVDPSAPATPTPSTTPSTEPSADPADPADPAAEDDPTCAPCPEDVDPTPEAPCLPPATASLPVDPAATDPSAAAPSSGQ